MLVESCELLQLLLNSLQLFVSTKNGCDVYDSVLLVKRFSVDGNLDCDVASELEEGGTTKGTDCTIPFSFELSLTIKFEALDGCELDSCPMKLSISGVSERIEQTSDYKLKKKT